MHRRALPSSRESSAGDWERMVAEQDAYGYAPRRGLLGDTLASAGRCATAVGPGAALALAHADGTVDRYLPAVAQVDGRPSTRARSRWWTWAGCPGVSRRPSAGSRPC